MDPKEGNITIQDIKDFKEKRRKYTDESICMYWDHHVQNKTLDDISKAYGLSRSGVKKRINSFIGEINRFKQL